MKTLIAYYSFTGNNEALVDQLQKRLSCDVLRIEEEKKRTNISILLDLIFKRRPRLKKYDPEISAYDNIILVAPIWAGKIGSPMLSFLRREKNNIRYYAFITLCGGVTGQKEKIRHFLESNMNTAPITVEELWVNDLLTPEKRDQIKFTTPYRIKPEDWAILNPKIEGFVQAIKPSEVAESHA